MRNDSMLDRVRIDLSRFRGLHAQPGLDASAHP
jgi:hypothetical protein